MFDITNTQTIRPQSTKRHFGIIGWLQRVDAAYRQAQKLKKTSPEHLDDMGISREAANTAFLTQFRDSRWTPRG